MATRFAAHWIADALAGDESFDFSAIQVLLEASSEPLAGAPEATRERLALRSLQEVSSLIPAAGDAAATAGVLRVHGARSGEDVLSRLIREVEISGKLEKDLLPPFSQDIQETIRAKKFTLPETSFQLLKGLDPWITSMTPTSQLEHSSTEQCANDQTLCSNHECVNTEKPVFPTNNAEVQQDTMTNLVNESETGNLQKDPSAPTCVLHQPCTPESRHCVPLQEDTTDAVGLGARSPERSPIVEGNMSVGSVPASAGCDAPLQGSCNGANQGSKSEINLQQGAATEDRMAFEDHNADKSPLEVSDANKANQALHDDGSMMKNNTVHAGLTVQTASVSQNCNVPLHDKTSEANCFPEQNNDKSRTDVEKDNCRTSIPSSSKDRDRARAKKTSNEEKSKDTSPEISVCSKDQDIDDTHEGLSQQDLCIKCGKDGELLTCSDCSLAAHDSCFGSSVTFEGTGLFYCPICFCKKAREAYLKAKKTYFEAKENVAVYLGTAQVSKQHDEQLNGVQPGAANRDGHSNGCGTSKRNSIHQDEAYNLAQQDEEPHQPRKKKKINARGNGHLEEVLTEKVPFENSGPDPEKKQQAGDKEAAPSKRILTEKVPLENSGPDPEKMQQAGDKEARKEATPRKRRSVHSQKRYSNPIAPAGRRKNLAWTEKEEAGLREVMAKFAPQNDAQIPWVQIRKYGCDVFHKTRLPCDLRDKWRNMTKKCAGY